MPPIEVLVIALIIVGVAFLLTFGQSAYDAINRETTRWAFIWMVLTGVAVGILSFLIAAHK